MSNNWICKNCSEVLLSQYDACWKCAEISSKVNGTDDDNSKGTFVCPYCSEEIKKEAIKCRYCHEFINTDSRTTYWWWFWLFMALLLVELFYLSWFWSF